MFMGFGFLSLNMKLLLGNDVFIAQKVMATAKGKSGNSIELIRNKLRSKFTASKNRLLDEDKLHLLDKTCSELIFEFEEYLAS